MNIKSIILSIFALLIISSCRKTFLDLAPYDQVSSDVAITNESEMQTALNGAYASLHTDHRTDPNNDQSNLFDRTLPLIGDLMADNEAIVINNSNRYTDVFNYSYLNTNSWALDTWTAGYSSILSLNNVINANVPATANSSQLKGEALTLRALVYFYLVRLYAKPYTVDANADGIPIVLTYDPTLKPARSKVTEVYAQIAKDLSDAFGMMTNTSKNSSYVTKYVARALEAKVDLTKGDYAAAKTAAIDVVNNGGYSLAAVTDYIAYWDNPTPVSSKVETIFEVSNDGINNNGNNSLAYFLDPAGYGDVLAVDALYNLYSATDVRKDLMVPGFKSGQPIKIIKKYPNASNASDKDDDKVLRYSDVLLILAEACARTNDEVNALLKLNQVGKQRDPSFIGYAATGQALIDDIILERRKELAFEGDRYWDLARLKLDVVRINLNNNYPSNTPLTLPAGDNKRIWPIPQDEIDANPAITQNPGY
ncbi:MAG: RagB/SusD family nutrient uptake outer membrane protein [Bacteroidota bacterium]|nr:RagB/SusD family nutrient uptake outer membrane protein [Bacteroidota bacterium]